MRNIFLFLLTINTCFGQSFLKSSIELAEFNCKYYKDGIKIYWYTVNESNNNYFELLSSTDGFNFNKIGNMKGKGNTSELVDYFFIDKNYYDSIVYYKLKQINYDGHVEEYGPIAFICRHNYPINAFYDIFARDIKQDYEGIKIQQK